MEMQVVSDPCKFDFYPSYPVNLPVIPTVNFNKTKFILFNGPPSCGKDTACDAILRRYAKYHEDDEFNHPGEVRVNPVSFKEHLIELTCKIYGVSRFEWNTRYTRELKEMRWSKLGNISPRQALIFVSERVIKPIYGDDYMGKMVIKDLRPCWNIFSDSGFVAETLPLINKLQEINDESEDFHIIRINRPGFDFAIDSRSYLCKDDFTAKQNTAIKFYDIFNFGDEMAFTIEVLNTVVDIIK